MKRKIIFAISVLIVTIALLNFRKPTPSNPPQTEPVLNERGEAGRDTLDTLTPESPFLEHPDIKKMTLEEVKEEAEKYPEEEMERLTQQLNDFSISMSERQRLMQEYSRRVAILAHLTELSVAKASKELDHLSEERAERTKDLHVERDSSHD